MHPGTGSFARFDYPSRLDPAVQERMAGIARRVVSRLGLEESLFNIEMIHDPARDAVHVIEVNPRISGQFGDLYQKVDGANTYQIALALAAGDPPPRRRRRGCCRVASSVPLRVFEPVRVLSAPTDEAIRAVEADCPGTLIWTECRAGLELSDFERLEDGASVRYGVVNAGAADLAALLELMERVRKRLAYRFEPLRPGPDRS
jgi:hypothetical protein